MKKVLMVAVTILMGGTVVRAGAVWGRWTLWSTGLGMEPVF